MTSRESEILNIIYRSGGRCSARIISRETGLSSDYVFLISRELLNQKLIKKIANNAFILTNGGRLLLENLRGGANMKKTSTLMEVSRSFGIKVESLAFPLEIHFINPEAIHSGCYGAGKEFMSGQPYLIEHNLSKGQITEKADARSIQKNIKRLIFTKGLPRSPRFAGEAGRQAGRKLQVK